MDFPETLLTACSSLSSAHKQYMSSKLMVEKLTNNERTLGNTPWYQGMLDHWGDEHQANADALLTAIQNIALEINRAFN
jgi:hypothetical protein